LPKERSEVFCFLIIKKCGTNLELDCNKLRAELDLDFFLS
jgi:hypothetical protein